MEKKIGQNKSSGARKVEKITKNVSQETVDTPEKSKKQPTAKKAPKKSVTKKTSAKPQKSVKNERALRAEKREAKEAEKRVERAKAKAAKKEKKLLKRASYKQAKMEKRAALKEKKLEKKAELAQKRLERKEKKLAAIDARKQKRADLKAERIARRELLKNESVADKRKRVEREKRERIALHRRRAEEREKAQAEKRAAREAAHERKANDKKHRREQKTERKKHAPGFGGWLAAVISLGTACLALATVVTAGSVKVNEMNMAEASGYRSTLYEMVSVSEDMDNNLSKLRVSGGALEQRRLLTDLLVDSALMESALERIPVDAATSTDISSFVNKTGSYARTLLSKIASGETLTAREKETLTHLYNINTKLYGELNTLATHMSEQELRSFINGKEGEVSQKFTEIGRGTKKYQEETVNAPFTGEGNVGENRLTSLNEVSSAEAQELVQNYLAAYHIKEATFTGEAVTRRIRCYNFMLKDTNDVEIFAQVTKNGGKLVFFDTYETCSDKNFNLEQADQIAREFLGGLGIENVEAVWLSDAGMVADLTYVTVDDGARIYSDMIRVRVCESKGRVIGVDTHAYLLNNAERTVEAGMSRSEAEAKLSSGLEVKEAHLALVPVNGKEVAAYEFFCTYGEDEYVIYLDANTGEEVQVYLVRNSARGSYLR